MTDLKSVYFLFLSFNYWYILVFIPHSLNILMIIFTVIIFYKMFFVSYDGI